MSNSSINYKAQESQQNSQISQLNSNNLHKLRKLPVNASPDEFLLQPLNGSINAGFNIDLKQEQSEKVFRNNGSGSNLDLIKNLKKLPTHRSLEQDSEEQFVESTFRSPIITPQNESRASNQNQSNSQPPHYSNFVKQQYIESDKQQLKKNVLYQQQKVNSKTDRVQTSDNQSVSFTDQVVDQNQTDYQIEATPQNQNPQKLIKVVQQTQRNHAPVMNAKHSNLQKMKDRLQQLQSDNSNHEIQHQSQALQRGDFSQNSQKPNSLSNGSVSAATFSSSKSYSHLQQQRSGITTGAQDFHRNNPSNQKQIQLIDRVVQTDPIQIASERGNQKNATLQSQNKLNSQEPVQEYNQDKDAMIKKLMLENKKIREKLKEVNLVLDQTLEKAHQKFVTQKPNSLQNSRSVKSIHNSSIDQQLQLRDKEMINQEVQIKILQREVNSWKTKYDNDANAQNYIKLENSLKDQERKNQELMKEVKALERIQNQQGKALSQQNYKKEFQEESQSQLDELKAALNKIRDLEEKRVKDEQTHKKQFDHMIKLEEKIKQLNGTVPKKQDQDFTEIVKQVDDLTNILQQVERAKEIAEKQRDQEIKKFKKLKKDTDTEISQLKSENDKLSRLVREKDQEGRLASSKLREIQKTVKHGILSPLNDNTLDRGRSPNYSSTGGNNDLTQHRAGILYNCKFQQSFKNAFQLK
eukprot:403351223